MPRLIILRGLPGSGKTTYAREWCDAHPNFKRICKDDLRAMLDDGLYSAKNEQFIKQAERALIVAAWCAGRSVILDNVHANTSHVLELRDFARELGFAVSLYDLDTTLEECIARDAQRKRSVGVGRITELHEQLVRARRDVPRF